MLNHPDMGQGIYPDAELYPYRSADPPWDVQTGSGHNELPECRQLACSSELGRLVAYVSDPDSASTTAFAASIGAQPKRGCSIWSDAQENFKADF